MHAFWNGQFFMHVKVLALVFEYTFIPLPLAYSSSHFFMKIACFMIVIIYLQVHNFCKQLLHRFINVQISDERKEENEKYNSTCSRNQLGISHVSHLKKIYVYWKLFSLSLIFSYKLIKFNVIPLKSDSLLH